MHDQNIKIVGFDTFTGLNEDWKGNYQAKGSMNLDGKIPNVQNNTSLIKGKIQDTLLPFLEKEKLKVLFINIDVDTYETTKFILQNLKSRLSKGTIINFDDFYNYPGWTNGEYKALKETFNDDEYEYLAFSTKKGHVSIKLN